MASINYSEQEIAATARHLLQAAGDLRVWTFTGTLGAGKTTLIKAICELLNVEDQVSSPTYTIIQTYASGKEIIHHIDAYRIEQYEDAYQIGLDELLEGDTYCFIEWPEKIAPLLPDHYFSVHIDGEGDLRHLTYRKI